MNDLPVHTTLGELALLVKWALAIHSSLVAGFMSVILWLGKRFIASVDQRLDEHSKEIALRLRRDDLEEIERVLGARITEGLAGAEAGITKAVLSRWAKGDA